MQKAIRTGLLLCLLTGNIYNAASQKAGNVFFDLLQPDLPGMEKVKEAAAKNNWEAAAAHYLEYRQTVSPARWHDETPATEERIRQKLLADADSICANYIMDQTNPVPMIPAAVFMGKDFDWKYNPVPKDSPAYDDGWSWSVMSRAKFFITLAKAYQATKDRRYAEKWTWLLKDFAKDNPLTAYQGKQVDGLIWRTLDAAIRVSSLVNAYFIFRDSPLFTPADQVLLSQLMYEHAKRLYTVLISEPDRTGNWVTTECYGLYVIGATFPEFKEAAAWREAAINRFYREIERVVPPDGLQAELSPSYHYGVVASYHGIYDIAKMNNLELPSYFTGKLLSMYRAPVLIMDQEGDFVHTNDSNPRDIRKISKKGLEVAGDPLLLWAASNGKKGKEPPATTMLPYAGFYMMRSGWKKDDLFLFFRGGPAGIGHIEQDMLQIVLKAKGKTLLFDPGKYNYDQSEWRRFSINTPSHNTAIVDGKWQNREKIIPEKYLPVQDPWASTPVFDYVSATYADGYETNDYAPAIQYKPEKWRGDKDTSVKHTRTVLFLKPWYALVVDQFNGSGRHQYDVHYHLDAPDAVYDTANSVVFSQRTDDVQLGLFALNNDSLQVSIVKGQKEPLLGWQPVEHRPIPTIRFRKEMSAPATVATFLYPFGMTKPIFGAKELGIGGKIISRYIKTGEEELELVLGSGKNDTSVIFSSSLAGKVEAAADMLVIRKRIKAPGVYTGSYGLRSYSDKYTAFTSSAPATLAFTVHEKKLLINNAGDQPVTLSINRPYSKKVVLPAGSTMKIDEHNIIHSEHSLIF